MYPKTVARRLTSEAFTSTTACGRPTEGLLAGGALRRVGDRKQEADRRLLTAAVRIERVYVRGFLRKAVIPIVSRGK